MDFILLFCRQVELCIRYRQLHSAPDCITVVICLCFQVTLVACYFWVLFCLSHAIPCGRATWPVLKSSSWQSSCADVAFLLYLHRTDCWDRAGLSWRSNFFLQGELYRVKGQNKIYRALGGRTSCQPLWPCRQISTHVWEEDPEAVPEWHALLAWDEWEALPSRPLSPMGAFARGFGYQRRVSHLILGDARSPLVHAALLGFRGCTASDIRALGKEFDIYQRGLQSQCFFP